MLIDEKKRAKGGINNILHIYPSPNVWDLLLAQHRHWYKGLSISCLIRTTSSWDYADKGSRKIFGSPLASCSNRSLIIFVMHSESTGQNNLICWLTCSSLSRKPDFLLLNMNLGWCSSSSLWDRSNWMTARLLVWCTADTTWKTKC